MANAAVAGKGVITLSMMNALKTNKTENRRSCFKQNWRSKKLSVRFFQTGFQAA